MDLLKAYGGNTVRVYDPDSIGVVLDRAHRLGLAVVADLPLPESVKVNNKAARYIKEHRSDLLNIVEQHKDHPALLFWILGNEVFNKGYSSDYIAAYNRLAADLRRLDPHHPISSTFNVHQLGYTKIRWTQPDIDFVSFNLFGNLQGLPRDLWYLTPIWRGPYMLTEWSYNGPWEVASTRWGAPLESPNSTKADHLATRYITWVDPLYDDDRFLGELAFFWGNKYEITPSWYSFFSPEGATSEMAFTLGQLWAGKQETFPGPSVEYLLLNGKGEGRNQVLPPGEEAMGTVRFIAPPDSTYSFKWEIRGEDWQDLGREGMGPPALKGLFTSQQLEVAIFQAPQAEGPYRLYYQVSDPQGYFSADNIPFYVLNPDDAE